MGTIIEEIRDRMDRFAEARVEHDACSITYVPNDSNGFVVRLIVLKDGPGDELYSVCYNGAHAEFRERGSAIIEFGFGLSNGCRLREFSRGGKPYRWIVDVEDRAGWRPDWDIIQFSAANWQFWRTTTVRHLQNQLIDLSTGSDSDSTANELVPRTPGGGLPSLLAAKEIPKIPWPGDAASPSHEWLGRTVCPGLFQLFNGLHGLVKLQSGRLFPPTILRCLL